jgi:hypothetical protein
MQKLKAKVCNAPGCSTVHKAPGPYCAEHAHLIDQWITAQPAGTTVFGRPDVFKRKPKHGLGG